MKKLIYLSALVLLAACSEDKSEGDKTSSNQESSVKDTISLEDTLVSDSVEMPIEEEETSYFTEADSLLFAKYHKTKHWNILQMWCENASNLETDKDFKKWFDAGMKLRADLSDEIGGYPESYDAYEMVEAFEKSGLQEKLRGLIITCVAECSENEYSFSPGTMDSIAKLTSGKEDDAFTEIWLNAEGYRGHCEEYGFKTWFGQTWDYGGSSLVGDSSIYDFIVAYDEFERDYGLSYQRYLKPLRTNALEMLHTYKSYMYSAKKVIAEIERVINDTDLSEEEISKLLKRKKELMDPEANELEVDCEKGGCAYG